MASAAYERVPETPAELLAATGTKGRTTRARTRTDNGAAVVTASKAAKASKGAKGAAAKGEKKQAAPAQELKTIEASSFFGKKSSAPLVKLADGTQVLVGAGVQEGLRA